LLLHCCCFFSANRTLVLKETSKSIKHSKKNKNYNEILEKPSNFNLQTVSTARRFVAKLYVSWM
jgi:hypothetical protein